MKIIDKIHSLGSLAGASNRRNLLAGVTVVSAAAIAARTLPAAVPAAAVLPVAKAAPDTHGGYQLTAHVRRYYETTRA